MSLCLWYVYIDPFVVSHVFNDLKTTANARQTVMFCGRKGIATRPQLNLQ